MEVDLAVPVDVVRPEDVLGEAPRVAARVQSGVHAHETLERDHPVREVRAELLVHFADLAGAEVRAPSDLTDGDAAEL